MINVLFSTWIINPLAPPCMYYCLLLSKFARYKAIIFSWNNTMSICILKSILQNTTKIWATSSWPKMYLRISTGDMLRYKQKKMWLITEKGYFSHLKTKGSEMLSPVSHGSLAFPSCWKMLLQLQASTLPRQECGWGRLALALPASLPQCKQSFLPLASGTILLTCWSEIDHMATFSQKEFVE